MSAFEIIPFFLFLVVIGTAIAERINVPYPLILVVAGLLAGLIPGIPSWHPPSNLALVLFLPPILFAAARVISWEDIKKNLFPIFSLSIVLVLINATVIAVLMDLIVPSMTLPAALVLGAIIAPTDSTAATSILNKLNARQSLVRTLEIESLFNDAISIVLYSVAVAFVFTGTINLTSFTHSTLINGVGGMIVGLVFSYFSRLIIEEFLTTSENELPIIMSLILAYVAYLFAEKIGVSGVLAVVTAGLFHRKTERSTRARTRLAARSIWDAFIFFLNGLIFIVIGVQFPSYLKKVLAYMPLGQLLLFSFTVIFILWILRFIWVTITDFIHVMLWRLKKNSKMIIEFSWRTVFISSWSGMRGLVSLALAIALPITIAPTQAFPNRDLIIFLTIMTILFTLVVQGLTLPFFIKHLKVGKRTQGLLEEANKIYLHLTKQAINHVKKLETEKNTVPEAAMKLVNNYYSSRLLQFKLSETYEAQTHELGSEALSVLGKILEYERNLLHKLLEEGKINEEVYLRILHKIDRDEFGFGLYR